MSGRLALSTLNAMDAAAFAGALGFVYEHSPWVMVRAHAGVPFADVEALWRASVAVLDAATGEERAALVRAHPELAGKAAIAGDLTDRSRAEQRGAGLDRLTPDEFARFHSLNAAYGAKFGFPFVICVRLHDRASILAAMARRLGNTAQAEVAEAIVQIGQIGRLRLLDAVGP